MIRTRRSLRNDRRGLGGHGILSVDSVGVHEDRCLRLGSLSQQRPARRTDFRPTNA